MPDGASTLVGWCSSMISADSKYRAASAANLIIRTAPIEKFGTTITPTEGASLSQPSIAASRSSVNPLVPATTLTPWSTHQRMLSITTPGWVKSIATSAPASSLDRVVLGDLGEQVEAVGVLDRRAREHAHLPGRADHAHLRHAPERIGHPDSSERATLAVPDLSRTNRGDEGGGGGE